MSISKQVTYIPAYMIDSHTDPLRRELSAYWKKYTKSVKFARGDQILYLMDYPKLDDTNKAITNFAFSEETDVSNSTMPYKKISMRVYGDPTRFKNQRQWREYFTGQINTGKSFFDNIFTCDRPFTEKEALALGGTSLVKTYDVALEYNFYQEDYERALGRKIPEKLLPNLYTLYSYKEEIDDESVKNTALFRNHVSLNGQLHENTVQKFSDKGAKNPKAINSLQYLSSFARVLTRRTNKDYQNITTAYRNTMLPASNMSLLGYNVKREMFPMYGEITFATDKTTQFTQILRDSNTNCVFMKDIAKSLEGSDLPVETRGYSTSVMTPVMVENELGTKTITNVNSVGGGNVKIWKIADWIERFRRSAASPMQNSVFLGKTNKDAEMATTTDYGFYRKMMETIFIGKLRTLVKSQQRRFDEILDGDSAYSEEVFYKIDKLAKGTEKPIQTFWIPNTNEVDVMNFIDTQVRYSNEYTYKASVFKLVIGAKYEYSSVAVTKRVTEDCVEFISVDTQKSVKPRVPGSVVVNNVSKTRSALEVQGDKRFMAEFDITVTPNVLLVEVPFFSVTSRLIDDPPLAPEVEVLPYRSDSRFLKFFMQGATGEQNLHPIIMTDKDRRMVQMIRSARNLDKNEPITYKSDDYPSYFEVYRIDEPPISYRSFVENIRSVIKTDISDKTKQKAASMAYIEQIVPNKKFYYMFRSVDVHGKIGYPSPVYEVEMLNDKGAFYPIVKIHEMNPRPARITKKSGRRFIQIIPNIGQTLINEGKSGFENYTSAKDITGELTYGFKAESIWDKKFKVRLTSKKTGKKIDLNLQFSTKKVKTDFEESS